MKELFNVIEKDIQSENFTKKECIIFGIIAPLAAVVAMGVAGSLLM